MKTLVQSAVVVCLVVGGARVRADDGTTPLHWAVRAGDVDAVKRLLHGGANARVTNRYGVTPLSLAAENGDARMIDVLLAAGADAKTSLSSGQTMLMLAARSGNPAAIKTLVAHGALVNARENVLGETAPRLARKKWFQSVQT